MSIFKGLSAFPITPSDAHGHVDTDAVGRLVTRLEAAQVHSIGLLGSTGTYAYLNRPERQRAIKAAAAATETPLIVGIGGLRTDDVVTYAQDAQQAGAQGLLLAPVSYTPLTADEVFMHFKTVAEATDLPLCIYNNPTTTHFNFETALLQRLADVPNIAAAKMPAPMTRAVADDFAQLRANLPPDFAIGYSGDWVCPDALLAGADTWYSVLGGILPDVAMDLTKAAQSGDAVLVQKQNAALDPLWSLFKVHGGLRVVYAIANHRGLTDATPPRPILPLNAEETAKVVKALEPLDI